MKKIKQIFIFINYLFLFLLIFSCENKTNKTIHSFEANQIYKIDLPAYMPSLPKEPIQNLSTKEGVILGKALFFDTQLSKTNTVSCATCHNPKLYFTDNLATSNLGITRKNLARNTPTLINVVYAENGLFLDGGIKNLESLPAAPLQHPDEMAMDLKALPFLLQKNSTINYSILFKNAFDSDTITNALIFRALAQYQRTIISPSSNDNFNFPSLISKWDSVQQNKTVFLKTELKGQELFRKYCNNCHTAPLFSDYKFHFAHLDTIKNPIKSNKKELGRQTITENPADYLKFKTPTLRHISKTFPYLHDGSVGNLDYFLEGNNLSDLSDLSKEDKMALLDFLNCL